jgi:Flp pilus assembly protein TadD
MRADDEPEIEWATELYKKAFDLNPYDDLAVMSYGVGLARQGKLREGEKWIKKATELNPANLRAQQNLAALRSQL